MDSFPSMVEFYGIVDFWICFIRPNQKSKCRGYHCSVCRNFAVLLSLSFQLWFYEQKLYYAQAIAIFPISFCLAHSVLFILVLFSLFFYLKCAANKMSWSAKSLETETCIVRKRRIDLNSANKLFISASFFSQAFASSS